MSEPTPHQSEDAVIIAGAPETGTLDGDQQRTTTPADTGLSPNHRRTDSSGLAGARSSRIADTSGLATAGLAGARSSRIAVPTGAWRRAFLTGLSLWATALFAYLLVNAMLWMTRSEGGPRLSGALEVWNRWDTGHYVTIALNGYNPATENPGFFPLYSILMAIFEPVLPGGMLSAGLIISWVACVAALTVVYRLTDDLFGSRLAERTTVFLIAFPFAFYLCSAYSTSLFLALSAASLYSMRRGHWWMAGVWAGLASGTRQAGVLLAFAFVIEYLRQREWRPSRIRWDAAAIAIVPTGLISFALYNWYAFDDPLKFVHVRAFWGQKATAPWLGTERAIETIADASQRGAIFQPLVVLNVIDLVAVPVGIILLVLAVVGPWRLGEQAWYLVATAATGLLMALLLPFGGGVPLHGVPRYFLEMLPAFMVLAKIGENRYFERFYLIPAIAVQATLLIAYFNNIWLS